jgi:hypothetical protein
MNGSRWGARAYVPLLGAALLVMMACGGSTVATNTATAGPPTPTATPVPSCATLLPGATAAASIAGFSDVHFPTGAVDTAPHHSAGATGQFQIIETDVCYSGTLDDLTGPFSGHHSVVAYLYGAGWGNASLFPYHGDFRTNCPTPCYQYGNDQRYLALEHITDHGGHLITYHLRLAAPPAAPHCSSSSYPAGTPYAVFEDPNASSLYHFQLPPLSQFSNYKGGGHAGGTDLPLCSAGTHATMLAFMKNAVTSAGWHVTASNSTSFSATKSSSGRTYQIDVNTVSGLISSASEWVLTIHVPM